MKAHKSVEQFEKTIAEFAGANFAVSVSSCTNAILLCCIYKKVKQVGIPCRTYAGVANSIIHAGGSVHFHDFPWQGVYELIPYGIMDSALQFKRGMYRAGYLWCLSFHTRKHIPIGRGGMILTDCKVAADWLRMARYDGYHKEVDVLGWNMYMTPEQASRGLMLFEAVKDRELKDLPNDGYPDLSKWRIYK